MAYTNKQVIQQWVNGNAGKNGKRNLKTDGLSLWSYRMLIGITLNTGEKCILQLGGKYRVTNTTQRHTHSTYDYKKGQWLARFVTPVKNDNPRNTYLWNCWLFPADMLAIALGNPQPLPYSDAIINMQ